MRLKRLHLVGDDDLLKAHTSVGIQALFSISAENAGTVKTILHYVLFVLPMVDNANPLAVATIAHF